ncbi:type I toxin-antitoxin system SymE family toxin [Citrobacter werkmanii]|nr:type I toxin-antitoxin system SymE family toxin [Citrobacter werkmanii]MBQ4934965.1 type I toxin-antitoxin system SymE family toxin [Citrobacter werkmanii]MBQ4947474.1 type I toxin-antitoxin system SymE family toxin [Citrobacter werkmanii]MBQ4963463.1 type I toxin-antitoxin system SymE family toxin [Citrobacter werkmanii]
MTHVTLPPRRDFPAYNSRIIAAPSVAAINRPKFSDHNHADEPPRLTRQPVTEGFTDGVPINIRVMPDCIVITTQNTR